MPRNPPQWPESPTFQQWGRDILKWGVGVAGAKERSQTVTKGELLQNRMITTGFLSITRDFYADVYQKNSKNRTALARQDLMQYMIELLLDT